MWTIADEIELLIRMKSYIQEMEEKIDWEWGDYRTAKELYEDRQMPQLYQDILNRLNMISERSV